MKRTLLLLSTVFALAVNPPVVCSQVITFEQTPGGTLPVDNSFLNAPYSISGGTVSFYFDVNGNNAFDSGVDQATVFEATGQDGSDAFLTAFYSTADTPYPAVASQLGDYFLRHLQPGPPPPPLIVDYNTSTPISALSGEIWDIDGSVAGTEQWQVDVLDSAGAILATQSSPIGTGALLPLDGQPWTFSFSGLPSGVDKVRLTFIGTKLDNAGLAFNNFSPFTVPEPSSIAIAICAALFCAVQRTTRRTAA
jgi:hypothetical protein